MNSKLFLLYIFALPLMGISQPLPSTNDKENIYFIQSSSKLGYCKDKVIYNTSPLPGHTMRWGDKTFDFNALWTFEANPDNTYYIKNKATGMYMKTTSNDKAGTATCTDDKSQATRFRIAKQNGSTNSFTITGVDQNPLHAQEYAGFMVTWNTYANESASSWTFKKVYPFQINRIQKKLDEKFELIWSDEFNDPNEDLSKNWNFEKGFVRNHEAQWYQRENAKIENGNLVIEGKTTHIKNPNYDPSSNNWKLNREYIDYTSSCLTSNNKFDFTYGRMEVRAKIPTSGGAWPAIWTLGYEQGGDFHWPSSGEVDLMEFYKNQTLSNLVWGSTGNSWNQTWESRVTPIHYWNLYNNNWGNEYHVWRMDWDKECIKIYLDDELVTICNLDRTINRYGTADGTNPFRDKPQYILLNLAMGGNSGGAIDNSAFPLKYYIDYVRIYQLKGQKHRINKSESITGIENTVQSSSPNTLTIKHSNDVLHIQTEGFDNGTSIKVYTASGQLIENIKVHGNNHKLQTKNWKHGIYIIVVSDHLHMQSEKIII